MKTKLSDPGHQSQEPQVAECQSSQAQEEPHLVEAPREPFGAPKDPRLVDADLQDEVDACEELAFA